LTCFPFSKVSFTFFHLPVPFRWFALSPVYSNGRETSSRPFSDILSFLVMLVSPFFAFPDHCFQLPFKGNPPPGGRLWFYPTCSFFRILPFFVPPNCFGSVCTSNDKTWSNTALSGSAHPRRFPFFVLGCIRDFSGSLIPVGFDSIPLVLGLRSELFLNKAGSAPFPSFK